MKNWKNWVIFKPLKDIYDSLFNNDNGFSFRKAAACFSICGVGAEVTYSISDDQFKLYALYGGSNLGTAYLQTEAGTLAPHVASIDNIEGAIIVPQGCVLALLCTVTPVGVSASSSLMWLEVEA